MAKRGKRPPLSEAQLEIMNFIWDQGEVTVSRVVERLREQRPVARNTVQTVIARLAERGWLRYRKQGNRFIYRAAVRRQETQRRLLSRIIETAFAGSADGLVRTLVETQDLSPEEIERIQALLDKAKRSES